ncbi:heparan N-sulfatase [candidate division KSB1 bacterium]|nr:sulfatase [candidate division KSB1 bacterium]RQV99754.1 MAG: heparan N-sulfatase [candidate division KSB1 bacterium]
MYRRTFLKSLTAAALSTSFIRCSTPKKSRPNILFAIADDATWSHMGENYNDWVRTPAFDRVAREGILFSRCYTPNAKCAPSRASILTGRNSWQLEEAANHWCYFPNKFKTYAEVLKENGYHVGYVAKGWAPGVVGEIDGVKRQLTGAPYNAKKLTPPAKHINSSDYAANFQDFIADKPHGVPFCFWYGSTEPHRAYEYGAGAHYAGKKIAEIDRVPAFWPDNHRVRNDLLDYAFEIEWFDQHLQKMLELLDKKGELDNTLVVVTADNGMPFPRIKGQVYEYSNHLPLAIMWKDGIKNPGRVVDDFVSFIDFAPTFLEVAGVSEESSGMQPVTGASLTNIFTSAQSGQVEAHRDHVLIGKERHDIGRPHDWGYPIRGIRKGDYLYIHNFAIERWPGGNPETGYLNCDGSPTKTEVLRTRNNPDTKIFWQQNFGKRPQEELYNVQQDPDCIVNLADRAEFADLKSELHKQLFAELKEQGDPRMFGKGYIFDDYLYADENFRHFYEKYTSGQKLHAGWVNESDFEPNFPE